MFLSIFPAASSRAIVAAVIAAMAIKFTPAKKIKIFQIILKSEENLSDYFVGLEDITFKKLMQI